jgi:hypothetical protein
MVISQRSWEPALHERDAAGMRGEIHANGLLMLSAAAIGAILGASQVLLLAYCAAVGAAAATRVDRLAAATPVVSLAGAMREGLRLLETSGLARHEMYVFTDCSRGAWEGASPLEVTASHPDASVLYVDVGARGATNFSLDAVDLASDLVAAGTPLALSVAASRTGPDATRAVAVEILAADGHYARRAVKPVAWKQGSPVEVAFEVAGLEPGVRQGRVVIDGSDDLEADDVRYFTVQVGAPARVLVAAPAPAERTAFLVS